MLILKNALTCRMFKRVKRFIGKAYRAIKLFTNPTKAVINLVNETIRDVGSKYPPQVQEILRHCGDSNIIDVKLCKEVVSANTELLMKLLAGKNTWEEAKKKYGFDKFYHLFMIITMDNGKQIHVEKNELIRMSYSVRDCPDALDLGNPNVKLNTVLDTTKNRMGDSKFFTYDPFYNNCQNFIAELLKTMDLWNETSKDFVYQDIEGLREELPSYTKYLAKGLTSIGAFVNTAYQKTKDYIDNGTKTEGLDYQTNAS